MKAIEVECLSDESNYVVLKTPGRNFPGMVLQGDTLRSLLRTAQRVEKLLAGGNAGEAMGELEDLRISLQDRCSYYEQVIEAEGYSLPYPDKVGNGTSGE